MSTLQEIISSYKNVLSIDENDEASKIKARFEFERLLLSSNTEEVLNFHLSCLDNQSDNTVYLTCRAAFAKRKDIDSFLLPKLMLETSKRRKADIIHILGRVRSVDARQIAITNLDDDDDYLREVCLYVIGWTGHRTEIAILGKHLMTESTLRLKITSGSALRQIAWRMTETKVEVIEALKRAFIQEQDEMVLRRIIELMGSIAVKNLGIREDKNNPDILLGDLNKAIIKTRKFIESF